MKILNLGSLNLDRVYDVEHFVAPGETILAKDFNTFCGGKGLNQSVALARAGAQVYHAGAVGQDGMLLLDVLQKAGADISLVRTNAPATGHAIIQVAHSGQNNIIVYGGANRTLTKSDIDAALEHFSAGDFLLLQNETAEVSYAIEAAKDRGMQVAFNASPITEEIFSYPLDKVDYFLVNEVEGVALAGIASGRFEDILDALAKKYSAAIVLTVGSAGAYYQKGGSRLYNGIYDVPVVDTTAAGDTFCGYFIACLARGLEPQEALRFASRASSLSVSKKGAANSIPTWGEVQSSRLFDAN